MFLLLMGEVQNRFEEHLIAIQCDIENGMIAELDTSENRCPFPTEILLSLVGEYQNKCQWEVRKPNRENSRVNFGPLILLQTVQADCEGSSGYILLQHVLRVCVKLRLRKLILLRAPDQEDFFYRLPHEKST